MIDLFPPALFDRVRLARLPAFAARGTPDAA
jgi:hypothetical protein